MPSRSQEKSPVIVNKISRFTARAVLVEINHREVWIPLSQIHEADKLDQTDEPTEIYVKTWFVKKEGLQ